MTARSMVFAALVSVPAASFLCGGRYLLFFLVFPVAAAAELNFRYFRNLFVLSFAPLVVLLWAELNGSGEAALRSIRWIAALAAGSYLAGALGTAGISCVLRSIGSFSPLKTLADTMDNAGTAVRVARNTWNTNPNLPVQKRISCCLSSALAAEPELSNPGEVSPVQLTASAVSWLFLLGSVSGRFR